LFKTIVVQRWFNVVQGLFKIEKWIIDLSPFPLSPSLAKMGAGEIFGKPEKLKLT